MHTASSDVPDARRMGTPSKAMNSGTMMNPPPTPTYPLIKPAIAPIATTFITNEAVNAGAAYEGFSADAPDAGTEGDEPAAEDAGEEAVFPPFASFEPFEAANAFLNMVNAEYAMIDAAAAMTSQAGDAAAAMTPTGERHAPARPHTMPTRATHVLLRTCFAMPESDVGMMVKREVAVAAIGFMPNTSLNSGTMITPPPMPKSPDSTPTAMPHSAATTNNSMVYSPAPRFSLISVVSPGLTPPDAREAARICSTRSCS